MEVRINFGASTRQADWHTHPITPDQPKGWKRDTEDQPLRLRDVARLVRKEIAGAEDKLRQPNSTNYFSRPETAGRGCYSSRYGAILGWHRGRHGSWPIPGVTAYTQTDHERYYPTPVGLANLLRHLCEVDQIVQRLISVYGAKQSLVELLDTPTSVGEIELFDHIVCSDVIHRSEQTPVPDPAESLAEMLGLEEELSVEPACATAGEGSEASASANQGGEDGDATGEATAEANPVADGNSQGDHANSPKKTDSRPAPSGQAGNPKGPEGAEPPSLIELLSDLPLETDDGLRLRRQAEILAKELRPFLKGAMLSAQGKGDQNDDDTIDVPLINPKALCRELISRSYRAGRWREREQIADSPKASAAIVILTDTSGSQDHARDLAISLATQLAELQWPSKIADWRIMHGYNGDRTVADDRWIQATAGQHPVFLVYLGDRDGFDTLQNLASPNTKVIALDNGSRVPTNHKLEVAHNENEHLTWMKWS